MTETFRKKPREYHPRLHRVFPPEVAQEQKAVEEIFLLIVWPPIDKNAKSLLMIGKDMAQTGKPSF